MLLYRGEEREFCMQLFLRGPVRLVSVCTATGDVLEDAKEGSSLVPGYLYLLGLLFAESHSDLELGLFINVHCRR